MPDVAAYQGAAIRATPRDDWWDAVAPRVLVIQGLDDLIAPPSNGRRYVEDHSAVARLVELHDAGHALIVEQAELVGETIIQFLLDVEGVSEPTAPNRIDN
jgi:pimeloyl-ACP methyl ester carboxylesterase